MHETVSPGVARLERRDANGWTVDMLVVDLGDGALVYSPTSFGDGTTERASAPFGVPRVLLAPNHYHHLSLPKYRGLFPDAVTIASDGALPRLKKQGHTHAQRLDAAKLPAHVRVVPVEGTKNGETLVIVGTTEKTLLVCDAFFNVTGPVKGAIGVVMRNVLRVTPGLQLGRTFEWVGIADRSRYRTSILDLLSAEKPTTIAFSHGAALRAPDAWQQLGALVERHV